MKSRRKNKPPGFNQFLLLLDRNFRVKMADKTSMVLLFGQAFVIALLIWITFAGFQNDYAKSDRFARTWFDFVPKYEDQGTVFNLQSLCEQSRDWAESHPLYFTEYSAIRRASILFLLAASAIWFGIINASREVVAEKAVLRREANGPLKLSSYLAAKACVMAAVAVVQTGILIGFASILLAPCTTSFFQLWLVLIATSFSASCLSLLISCLAPTEQAALVAVPILIIPQLLLGGLVRPIKNLEQGLAGALRLDDLILQKWSFKALLNFDAGAGEGAKRVLAQVLEQDFCESFQFFRFASDSMMDVFFRNIEPSVFACGSHAFSMILLHGLAPILAAYLVLKIKYG